MIIRKAKDSDRGPLARLIAYGFQKDFSVLTKDMGRITCLLAGCLLPQRFYVAEEDGLLLGAAACTDCTGRAVEECKSDCLRILGPARGLIAAKVFTDEFMRPLPYPNTTGFIEFVTVKQAYRGKGVAGRLIGKIIEDTPYDAYVLDVMDNNLAAQSCYERAGFREQSRTPLKSGILRGKRERIYMSYIKKAN